MLSTYARIYIGLLPELVDKIKKYSRHTQTGTSAALPITILPKEQIAQAISHPQCGYIKNFIKMAYSQNINADNRISDSQDAIATLRLLNESTLYTLQSAKENTTPASKARIEAAMESLNKQLLVTKTIQTDIDTSLTKSKDIKKDFIQLLESQDAEWDKFHADHLAELNTAVGNILETAGYHLPSGEKDNLLRPDLQDNLDFYTERASKDLTARELEKMLKLDPPDMATFFRIKAYLAIRSVNPPLEDRPKLMRKLEEFFENTRKKGDELLDKQLQETKVLNEKGDPILQMATSRQSELKHLEKDRKAILAPVTNDKLQRQIEEKIQEKTQLPTLGKS